MSDTEQLDAASLCAAGYRLACAADQVADEAVIGVSVDEVDVAVVHTEGQFFALHNQCSHANVPLSEGEVEPGTVECWLHGSCFDVRTGEPTNLPATEPVPTYPTAVVEGQVYVKVH